MLLANISGHARKSLALLSKPITPDNLARNDSGPGNTHNTLEV